MSAVKKLGILSRVLDGTDPATRLVRATEQITYAEALGYDSAWIAQHHFHGELGGMPSPLVFLASLATSTKRIRLGTGIILLAMEDPVRVAEDSAILDILLGQRLEIGLGSSGTPDSFPAFGASFGDRHDIYSSKMELLRRAWSGSILPEDNRLYPSAPSLMQRVWQATTSERGGRIAGLAGDGLMLPRTQPQPVGQPLKTLDQLQRPVIDAYLEALPSSEAPRILVTRSIFVADNRAEALAHAEKGLASVAERFRSGGHAIADNTIEALLLALDTCVGTPDEVTERLSRDPVLAAATDIVVQVHSVDPPHELAMRSFELFINKVAPASDWCKGT